jgi:hypothetical protein
VTPDDVKFASDLLNEPFFMAEGGFEVLRHYVTVDQDGMSQVRLDVFHADGVVIPSGSLGIVRAAEAERQGSQITIYTMVPIQATDEAAGMIADNVVYKGSQYEVTGQDDYFEWGFNVATAVLASPGGRPALYPQQLPKLPMGGLQ